MNVKYCYIVNVWKNIFNNHAGEYFVIDIVAFLR